MGLSGWFTGVVVPDLERAWHWIEGETEILAKDIWDVVKAVFVAAEPQVMSDIIGAAKAFVAGVGPDVIKGDLSKAEQDFMEWLQVNKATLVKDAEAIGGAVIQAILALLTKA